MLERSLNIANLLVSLSAIGTLVWWHGFAYTPGHMHDHQIYLHACSAFYILQFLLRGCARGSLAAHVRRYSPEAFLFLLYLIEALSMPLWGTSPIRELLDLLGTDGRAYLFILSLHLGLLGIVGIELGKAASRSTIWKLPLPALLVLSFLVLIAIGASLLMLPEMTADRNRLGFFDALFTSMSANCVTGLVVVDTATYFSMKGKMVLMLLIQLGGLNIMAFATFFISRTWSTVSRPGSDVLTRELLHVPTLHVHRALRMVGAVVFTAVVLEVVGAVLLFRQFAAAAVFTNDVEAAFQAVFLSISAFNNAGFTISPDGLRNAALVGNHGVHMIVASLIIAGGLGFTTLWDLALLKVFRQSGRRSSARLVGSRIALLTSFVLIIAGMAAFFVVERSSSLVGQDTTGVYVAAFFQSVTARTAGFNTVDMNALSGAGLVLLMVLMFIGASSGSTGGGIKTGTLAVLVLGVLRRLGIRSPWTQAALVKGSAFKKARIVLLSSVLTLGVGTALLSMEETDIPFVDLLFEEVSALGTVGLSRGITPGLTTMGKLIVMVTIFIGRVGPLGLAYFLIGSGGTEEEMDDAVMIG